MLQKGSTSTQGDAVFSDEAVKDPYVLEFLDLKDEYSESDLEEALIHQLEDFLLELGGDFSFIGSSEGCASTRLGTASIYCSFIAACAVSSSST